MAREVVRTLTTQYREDGADTVVRKAVEVRRSLEEAASGYRKMAREQEKTPSATKAVQRAHTDLANSLSGNSRALQIYNRDVEILRKSVASGLGVSTFRRDLQTIQQNLQNIGAPKASQFGDLMNFALMVRQSKKSAEDSASIFSANFDRIERKAAEVGQRISDHFDFGRVGRSAEESFQAFTPIFDRIQQRAAAAGQSINATFQFDRPAKSAADSFRVLETALISAEQQERKFADDFRQSLSKIENAIDPVTAAQDKLNRKLREFGELEARATTDAERGLIARARLAAQTEFRSSTQTDVGAYIDKKVAENAAAAAREAARFEEQLRRVKQEIDPLAAAQDELNRKLIQYAELRAGNHITDQQLVQGQQLAQRQFEYTTRSAEGLFDSTKLGAQDLQNLNYQLNDIAVSLASGQSPFTVMLQQGAQIGQMFGENATVGNALKSVGAGIVSFITSPINVAILAIAALAGSFALIYGAFKSDIKPISDQLEIQRKAADDLSGSYDNMAEAMKRAGQASVGLQTFRANSSTSQLGRSAQKDLKEQFDGGGAGLFDTILGKSIYGGRIGGQGRAAISINEDFKAFEEPLRRLLDGLAKGDAKAIEFQDSISQIANENGSDMALQKKALRLLEMSDAAADAQRQIEALTKSLDQMKDIQRETDFSDGIKGLESLIPDRRPATEQLAEYARQAREAAVSESERMKVTIKQKAAEDALLRVEQARRDGIALDLREITARSAEEKAQIAAQRVRIDLSKETTDQARIEREAQDAYTVSLKQAQFADSEAARQRKESRENSAKEMQVEIETLGLSKAAAAEATYRFQEMAAAKQAANEAGRLITKEEIQDIELAAANVGYLTDQLEAANKQADLAKNIKDAFKDLAFDRSLIGLTDEEKRVREFVNGIGAEYESANGQRLAAEFRYNKALEKTADQLQTIRETGRDTFLDIVDAISSGENALDAFAGALASVGKMFAKIGAEKVFDWLSGKNSGKATAYGGPVEALETINTSAQNLNKTLQSTPGFDGSYGPQRPSFDGSYGPQKFGTYGPQLPASVTGDGFSSARASQVVGQSVPVQMWNFFAGKGLAPHQIAGILGNSQAESGFNPTAVGDKGQAFGLFQHNDRKGQLFDFIGGKANLKDVNAQLEFVWKEFQTTERKAYDRLIKATDYMQANDAMISFERPSGFQNGVRNAHNYSGRLAFTKDALEKYGGGGGAVQQAAQQQTRAVSDGVIDANRRIANGAVPGVTVGDKWNEGGLDLRKVVASAATPPPQTGTGLFSKDGLNIASAGIGSFFSGYQSGSPISGGISGLFSGIGASSSIASAFPALAGIAGPLGAIGGAAIGILGGIMGGRKQRAEEHKKKAAAWEEIRPQYEAFDRSLSGEKQGDLRAYVTQGWEQLSGFMKVGGDAWKMGKGNSTAQFDSTGRKLFEGWMKMLTEFREGFDFMIEDLSSGQGLEGSFAKGRKATKDLADQIKKTRDDVDIAFGNTASIDFLNTPEAQAQAKDTERARADAIARFNDASAKYALSLLYTANTVSEVSKTVDGLRGTAAGLAPIFKDLGYSADDAATAINDRLTLALQDVANRFVDGFQREINSINGKDYLNDFTDLFKEFDVALSDADILEVDPAPVREWFKLASQDIVNGAELTGSAFQDLITAFPRLADIVHEFTEEAEEAIKTSAAEIASAISGYEDRLFAAQNKGDLANFDRQAARERIEAAKFGADALTALEKTLAAERANVVLSAARTDLDRAYEAEVDKLNESIEAREKEIDTLSQTSDRLKNFTAQIKTFRDSMKLDDNLSTLNGRERVDEARRQFDDLVIKARGGDEEAMGKLTGVAQEYLTEAKDFFQTSTDYVDIFNYVSRTLDDTSIKTSNQLTVSESQLAGLKQQIDLTKTQIATAKSQYEALIGINEGIKTLSAAMSAYAAAAAGARQQGITVPGTAGTTPTAGGGGGGDINGGWTAGSASGYLSKNQDVAAAIARGETFGLPAGMAPEVYASAHFGLYGQGEGRKYAVGGYTGPGGVNDVAGIAHRGEVIWSQQNVRDWGGPGVVDAMRLSGQIPAMAAWDMSNDRSGSGNEDELRELQESNRLLRALVTTTGGGLERLIEVTEGNTSDAEILALALSRSDS